MVIRRLFLTAAPAAIILQLLSVDTVQAYSCSSTNSGKEPNWADSGCQTFYQCDNYYGSLEHCPYGTQFHFEYKECLPDEDVFCNWQMESYSPPASLSSLSSGDGVLEDHECDEERGPEPDYEAEHCETFYECEDYHGQLKACLPGQQFDWHSRQCLEDEEVYCQQQRQSHLEEHVQDQKDDYDYSYDDDLNWLYDLMFTSLQRILGLGGPTSGATEQTTAAAAAAGGMPNGSGGNVPLEGVLAALLEELGLAGLVPQGTNAQPWNSASMQGNQGWAANPWQGGSQGVGVLNPLNPINPFYLANNPWQGNLNQGLNGFSGTGNLFNQLANAFGQGNPAVLQGMQAGNPEPQQLVQKSTAPEMAQTHNARRLSRNPILQTFKRRFASAQKLGKNPNNQLRG